DKVKEVLHLAWHPDGRHLATGCDDVKIHLWHVGSAREVMPAWTGHTNLGIQLAFNHAGDRLASRDWDGQARLWDTASGQVVPTLLGDSGLQFSPDDRLLGFQRSGRKVRLLRLTPGRELRVFPAPTVEGFRFIGSPAAHAAGRVLGVVSNRGLGFYDLDSGKELASTGLPDSRYASLRSFLPGDG